MSDLNVVEVCAGAGGQSLGLHLAGFRHDLAVELDANAAKTLRVNMPRLNPDADPQVAVAVGDAADEETWRPQDFKGKIALLAGGVPCPPFSVAGKQLGASDERDLFAWAVEQAGVMQPEALLLENVRGLNSPRFGSYRQAVVDRLAELGYVANWELLEARDYGVPQLRPRMVLVALREEYVPFFEWPEPKPTQKTVASTIGKLMAANGFEYIDQWLERADDIAPTIVGGSKKHGGADLGPTRAKLAWAKLWTDAHGIGDFAPGPDWKPWAEGRGPKLTVDMVARLQGWDGDDPDYAWEFTGLKTSRYRQIGNAFPPPVARAVGESIARALRKEGAALARSERKMHDEVYRLLRDEGGWMTGYKIRKLLDDALSLDEIERRVKQISHDFTIEHKGSGERQAYRLGQWKAFRGQEDHLRHDAFSSRKQRARVS